MSSKRAAVAEGLHTFRTGVRSLSRMDADVDGQRRSLNEFLSAFVTFVRSIGSQETLSSGKSTLNPSVFVLDEKTG